MEFVKTTSYLLDNGYLILHHFSAVYCISFGPLVYCWGAGCGVVYVCVGGGVLGYRVGSSALTTMNTMEPLLQVLDICEVQEE